MKNFEFEHEGKKYWYSRSVAVLGMIIGIDENKQLYVLANKRGQNTPDFQGCWCMPCGYLDFGETTEQAVIREVWEETGVKLEMDDFYLHSVDSIPEDEKQNVTIRYMNNPIDINKYQLTKENAEDGEVDDVKWIACAEIDKYEWAFNHNDLIKKYILY
jgi:8-oxo-dGTP diphosphatase